MLAIVGLLTIIGCRGKAERPGPQTYPVTGEVVTNGGRIPVGARIEFKPHENEYEFTAMGSVDAEGKFSLHIPYIDRVLPGATEGPHTVRLVKKGITTDSNGEDTGLIPIPGEFTVKPTENHFTITMPKAR